VAAAGFIPVSDFSLPHILVEEKHFLVVYKPPRMHSAPQPRSAQAQTLFDVCALQFPEIADVPGRSAGEGGLLHRLDYETQGLLLIARTKTAMQSFLEQQKEGTFRKEYSALAAKSETALGGFPPMAPHPGQNIIQSAFRPYGPGRKAVRPTTGEQYRTEILETHSLASGLTAFRLGIVRGFRHQIRSHLAWLRMPILNDSLYGGRPFGGGFLGLRAFSLSFTDPASAKERTFSIPQIEPGDV